MLLELIKLGLCLSGINPFKFSSILKNLKINLLFFIQTNNLKERLFHLVNFSRFHEIPQHRFNCTIND